MSLNGFCTFCWAIFRAPERPARKISASANMPIIAGMKLMPPDSSVTPKRWVPISGSRPSRGMKSPGSSNGAPLAMLPDETGAAQLSQGGRARSTRSS